MARLGQVVEESASAPGVELYDVVAGFFLPKGQFAVDDIVEIDGNAGALERMAIRVVMQRDARPNGSIAVLSSEARDWSRIVLDVGVDYKERVEEVIPVMRELGAALWDEDGWRSTLREEAPTVRDPERLFAALARSRRAA